MADQQPPVPTGLELTVFDDLFRNNPHERFDALRSTEPVHHDKLLNRYILTRAGDVAEVLKDRSHSVDPRKAAPGSLSATIFAAVLGPTKPSMLFLDDPDHKRLRNLVTRAFTARAIDALRPHIVAIADELLDEVESAEFDLIADYASPLPLIVIAELLGVDPADRADFRRWSQGTAQAFSPIKTPEVIAELFANTESLSAYFQRVIEARRTAPGDDLISAMLAADAEGDRLTDTEIVIMCRLLLIAGNVTTTDLIGNTMLALLTNPDELAKLRQQPGLITAAVEETLRRDPPVTQALRTATRKIEIGGVAIAEGQSIMPILMAAGLDPALHTDPLRYDIERTDKTHFAFGGGAHFCLGAQLARAEAEIAVERLLARHPALALTGRPIERNSAPAFNGVKELWVRA